MRGTFFKGLDYYILRYIIVFCFFPSVLFSQKQEISFLFIGDIMGHGPQIRAAWQDSIKQYDYNEVFSPVKDLIMSVDFAVANLEVTLAGPPYDGYPQFSSPDELAVACKENGIDALVTANNHSCDRGKKGVIRTVRTLDSLGISHTGTFENDKYRDSLNLLIVSKNNIKIGILNYTYGTNGLPFAKPSYVNLLDSALILKDLSMAQEANLDKLIVVAHWGTEYQDFPNKYQKNYNHFFLENGVDVVIGSHPHVLQPMIYKRDTLTNKEKLTVYSLGNFVSNQRERRKDGGAMFKLSFKRVKDQVLIEDKEYILTWVYKYKSGNKNHYQILPCAQNIYNQTYFPVSDHFTKMNVFLTDSRAHLENNEHVNEGSAYPEVEITIKPPVSLHPAKERKIKRTKKEKTRKRIFRKKRR